MEQQKTKNIQVYLEEFGKLLNAVSVSRKQLCYNYANAVAEFGLDTAEKAYSEAFSMIREVLPYMLLVGQGKAHVDVTLIGFESVRKRIVKLTLDQQNAFFENGVDIVDYETETVKHVPFRMNSLDWQVLWSDKKNGFRTKEEMLEYIHGRKEKATKNRKHPWELRKDGYVYFNKALKVTVFELVDILLKCIVKFTDLGLDRFIKIDLKEFQKAKQEFLSRGK